MTIFHYLAVALVAFCACKTSSHVNNEAQVKASQHTLNKTDANKQLMSAASSFYQAFKRKFPQSTAEEVNKQQRGIAEDSNVPNFPVAYQFWGHLQDPVPGQVCVVEFLNGRQSEEFTIEVAQAGSRHAVKLGDAVRFEQANDKSVSSGSGRYELMWGSQSRWFSMKSVGNTLVLGFEGTGNSVPGRLCIVQL